MGPLSRHIDQQFRLGGNAQIAEALRLKREPILRRFSETASEVLSLLDAEFAVAPVFDELVVTLDRVEEGRWVALADVAHKHGEQRSREELPLEMLVGEYRLLRVIMVDELHEGLRRGEFAFPGTQLLAAEAVLDAALERAAAAFMEDRHQALTKRIEAETKYLSFLSHDLRNNMNGITLAIEVLLDRLKDQPQLKEDCEALLAGRGAILETMEGMQRLMEAERMKRRKVDLKLVQVRLRNAVERTIINLRRRAIVKNLVMANNINPQAVLQTDEQLLRLIVQNLVGNALRYTDHGSVTLSLELEADGRPALVVADTGRGIAPEDQRRVFEAFERGERHGEHPGMGLGLAIVLAAAKALGAQLKLHSQLGKGSTFKVIFNPAAVPAQNGSASPTPSHVPADIPTRPVA